MVVERRSFPLGKVYFQGLCWFWGGYILANFTTPVERLVLQLLKLYQICGERIEEADKHPQHAPRTTKIGIWYRLSPSFEYFCWVFPPSQEKFPEKNSTKLRAVMLSTAASLVPAMLASSNFGTPKRRFCRPLHR